MNVCPIRMVHSDFEILAERIARCDLCTGSSICPDHARDMDRIGEVFRTPSLLPKPSWWQRALKTIF